MINNFPIEIIFSILEFVEDVYDLLSVLKLNRDSRLIGKQFIESTKLLVPSLIKFASRSNRGTITPRSLKQYSACDLDPTVIYYGHNTKFLVVKRLFEHVSICVCFFHKGNLIFTDYTYYFVFDMVNQKSLPYDSPITKKYQKTSNPSLSKTIVRGCVSHNTFCVIDLKMPGFHYIFKPFENLPAIEFSSEDGLRICWIDEKFPMMELIIFNLKGIFYRVIANFYNYSVQVHVNTKIGICGALSRVHFVSKEEIWINDKIPLQRIKLNIKDIPAEGGGLNIKFVQNNAYDDKIKELMIH